MGSGSEEGGDSKAYLVIPHKILLLVMADLSTNMPFPRDVSRSAEGTPRVSSAGSSGEKRSDIQGKNDHSQKGWN